MSMISVRAHNAHAPVFTKRMRAPLSLSLSNMATEHGVVMFGSLKVVIRSIVLMTFSIK